MSDKIADFLQSRKGRDIFLAAAVVLLGVFSFGLGRLSVAQQEDAQPVVIRVPYEAVQAHVGAAGVESAVEAGPGSPREFVPAVVSDKQYVASKNGAVYHLPWCSGAQRIKEENKVWFATKEEAEAAGLRPAANCKGL